MTGKSKAIKLLSVVLAFVMLFGVVPTGSIFASAATEGALTYRLSGDEAIIISCDLETEGDLTIPETLGSYPVTSISVHSFAECDKLTSVAMPDSVKTIGIGAFAGCDKLATVKIGSGVLLIGEGAFSDCASLEKIEVAAANTAYASDENGALYNKDKTDLLVYPIANTAATFTVADGVTVIKDSAFEGSKNVKTIILGDKVETIGKNAFLGSRSLESIVIGKNVETIGSDAFEGCTKLTGFSVNAGNAVLCSDDKGVLYSKDKTQLIKYPTGSSNTTYTVADETKKINVLSFANVTALAEISIGKNVTEIEASAFSGCTALTKVNFDGTAVEWSNVTIGANNEKLTGASFTFAGGIEHTHTYSPSVTKEATCTDAGTTLHTCECGHSYTETVEAKGHDFSDNTCSRCSTKEFVIASDGTRAKITGYNGNATDLVIPATIEGYAINAIGDGAFESCSSIVSITIPEGVEEIGSCAFYKTGFYNNSANWENGVLYIGKYLIEADETVIGAYTVKDGTTIIADYAFASLSSITSITFPAGLKVIGDAAFSNCAGLKEVNCGVKKGEWDNVVIGTSNDSLLNATLNFVPDPHTHSYDKVLEEVEVTCTEAGYKVAECSCGDVKREDYPALGHAFVNNICSGCGGREYEFSVTNGNVTIEGCHESLCGEVVIPSTISGYKVVAINANAFENNAKITAIVIPEGVTTIGGKAFFNCDELVSVSIPASVVSIGELCFADCAKLDAFSVDDANSIYSNDADGVLYNKDKTELLCYPSGKTVTEYEIPENVVIIGENAFNGYALLEKIIIPESVKAINEGAFAGCDALKEVVYAGTETKWGRVIIRANNTALTNAAKTFRDLSDAELALANAGILHLVNATATAKGINIIITASLDADFIGVYPTSTDGNTVVSVKTDGTLVTLSTGGNYIVSFLDCHKTGNETESEITIGAETYVVKFVFPTTDGGHDYSISEKINPTCVDEGCTRCTCSICGAYYDEDIVPATGHKYGNWVIDVDETCTEKGVKSRVCTVCDELTEGHKEVGEVLPSGHSYEGTVTPATCLEGGHTDYVCAECGDSYIGDAVPALGHTYGEWTVISEATCTTAGERTKTCSVCSEDTTGHVITEEIAAFGHSYDSVVTPPTEYEQGYTTYTCSNCGDTYEDNYVPAIGRVKSVSLENLSMKKDEVLPLSVTIDATAGVNYTVVYESKDESIATVDADGKVTAKNKGVTQIVCTVTDEHGNVVTDTCSVEVKFTILQWVTWFFVDILFSFLSKG